MLKLLAGRHNYLNEAVRQLSDPLRRLVTFAPKYALACSLAGKKGDMSLTGFLVYPLFPRSFLPHGPGALSHSPPWAAFVSPPRVQLQAAA